MTDGRKIAPSNREIAEVLDKHLPERVCSRDEAGKLLDELRLAYLSLSPEKQMRLHLALVATGEAISVVLSNPEAWGRR